MKKIKIMQVNTNNLRKKCIYSYDSLVEKLNRAILKDTQYAAPYNTLHDINIKGYILIDAEEIQKELDDLRILIGTIASLHIEDCQELKDVYTEIFPENEKKSMVFFNDEE